MVKGLRKLLGAGGGGGGGGASVHHWIYAFELLQQIRLVLDSYTCAY
jgi:hypothetical protein